jgi:hypothetical protein
MVPTFGPERIQSQKDTCSFYARLRAHHVNPKRDGLAVFDSIYEGSAISAGSERRVFVKPRKYLNPMVRIVVVESIDSNAEVVELKFLVWSGLHHSSTEA